MLVAYSASFLWHERPRFLAAVLAVTFSAALISLQAGLVLGIYAAGQSAGFIGAVIGAIVVLLVYHMVRGRRRVV